MLKSIIGYIKENLMIHIFPETNSSRAAARRSLGPLGGLRACSSQINFKIFWKKHKKIAYVTFYSLNTDFLCHGKNVKPKFTFMKF